MIDPAPRISQVLLGLAEGKGGGVLSNDAARAFLANPADAPGWAEGATYGNGIAHASNREKKNAQALSWSQALLTSSVRSSAMASSMHRCIESTG